MTASETNTTGVDAVWKIVVTPRAPRVVIVERGERPPLRFHAARVYFVRGLPDADRARDACRRLLADAVSDDFELFAEGAEQRFARSTVEVLPRPGVMDPAAASAGAALRDLGHAVTAIRSGRRYQADDDVPESELDGAGRELANPLVERVTCYAAGRAATVRDPFEDPPAASFELRTAPLRAADAEGLAALSRSGHLFLDVDEMRSIQAHYRGLEREPTDIELETLAQTWSEHCVHKTLKSAVLYRGPGFPDVIDISGAATATPATDIERRYDNLLAETIVAATRRLHKSWCWSVFEDNAGIIAFDDDHGVAFKVETHNHPSALEPYGGAATGIGGCIRDILGCGLGARPIANTDVFCFAAPDLPAQRVPAGLFHPSRSLREVVRGVRDYGNRMGIPTINGAIVFDDRYLGNPLVFCGCAGLIPRQRIHKEVCAGDRIVLMGGATGRDGIHGATFSSGGMTDSHAEEFAHAVQIGNAITEKKVLDVLLGARDHPGGPLYRGVTDCGAGGLSSAVGEMGAAVGATVELERVPLKYAGLRYDEIWISEAQERMVLAVPPERVAELVELCAAEDVEATDIGMFGAPPGRLRLQYAGHTVGELDMDFLHDGLPRRERLATWTRRSRACTGTAASPVSDGSVHDALLRQLAVPDIASKEWVIRQYDHEVQGGSVIKPLMGPGDGPTDGAVVRPLLGSDRGVVLSCGLCPRVSDVDPYVMAVAALDEAVRNNLCVGGDLRHMAVLDNFCWGGVSEPGRLGALVRAAQGCHDAAVAYGVPFISGKDSLNNVFEMRPEDAERMGWPRRLEIPDTLLISALSVTADVHRCRSSDLKTPGNRVLWVRPADLRLEGLAAAARAIDGILRDVDGIRAAHDVSDGGVLVAAAEMVIGSRYGVCLDGALPADGLFSEVLGSYLLEATPAAAEAAGARGADALRITPIGDVIAAATLEWHGLDAGSTTWSADALRRAWRSTFSWA